MKLISSTLAIVLVAVTDIQAAEPPAEFIEAGEQLRSEIPLGGDFKSDPKVPVIVAVGHGARIILSRDDGKTWKQVHWGYPGSDHGSWATKSVAYSEGIFVVPVGWGGATSYLASEDGVRWRHFTDGKTKLPVRGSGDDSTIMPGTYAMAGGKGIFVAGGYMTMTASPDLGKSFTTFSLRTLKDDPRARELVTHHVQPIYCGDRTGRFLALGNDRAKKNPAFGNLFASDDSGKTWAWLEPTRLNQHCQGYSGIASNGKLILIADKAGENVFRSVDAGNTWEGPFPTGTNRVTLSVVGSEFWLSGQHSRSSSDGKAWRDLPSAVPTGKIIASNQGTLINIDWRRYSILRSTDGGESWNETFSFEPETQHVHGAQGLRDIVFGYATKPKVIDSDQSVKN